MSTTRAPFLLAVLLAAGGAWAAKPQAPIQDDDDLAGCTPLVIEGAMYDFRARNTAERKWGYDDNQKYHYDPAINRMKAGDFTMPAIADLDFLLRRWPNHYLALQALTNYELGGGKRYQFPSTACYFQRARQFAPDDVNVYLNEGFYFWKKGNKERARSSWESALTVDPDSADAHYNLGLVLFDSAQYAKAAEHARAAYALGYPLQGLRKKLEKAGQWRDAPPAASSVPEATSR